MKKEWLTLEEVVGSALQMLATGFIVAHQSFSARTADLNPR
ncbi:hypothetical protein ACVXG9_09815 [Escherichia coli]